MSWSSRIINAPPRIVFEAWTKAGLVQCWWVPKSFGLTLLSCELDVRVGGVYASCSLLLGAYGIPRQIPRSSTAFAPRLERMKKRATTGRSPRSRLRKELTGRCSMHDLYPSKEALTLAPEARMGWTRRSTNSTNSSPARARIMSILLQLADREVEAPRGLLAHLQQAERRNLCEHPSDFSGQYTLPHRHQGLPSVGRPESYKQWTSAFGDGLYFEGSWQKGQRIRFLTPQGDEVTSEIAEIRPNEFISIRHLGYRPRRR